METNMRKNRKDAKFVKTSGTARLIYYLKERMDADVYINKKIDVTNLVKYMKKKKVKDPTTTYFHAFSMAAAKIIYNYPKLNRYIINKRCYERDDVTLSFVAKVDFTDNAEEMLCVLKVDKTDNIDNIRDKIKDKVDKVRNNTKNGTDDTISILDKLPNFLLSIVASVVKWLDRHDFLSKKFNDNLIYNSSIILSNLGSIKCGAIYHNITNFGSNSILMTIGNIHKEPMVNEKGEIEVRDVVEFGVTLDERIADGVYFSKAVNLLEYIIKNPELLEDHANEKIKEKKDFEY